MIRVGIDQQMVEEAEIKAEEMGLLRNSIRAGEGSVAGFIGEMLVAKLLGAQVSNTYDYDLIADGLRIDVKTKVCTCVPQTNWECSVAAYNTKQKCDKYFFVRVLDCFKTAWLLGDISKEDFYKQATFYKEGERDPKKPSFTFKADCYNLSVSNLTTQAGGSISMAMADKPQYDNKGRFTMFINDKKRPDKKDADMKGTYTDLDGIEYWVSAWRNKDQKGNVYYSGSIKQKEARTGAPARRAPARNDDDDIPY